MKVFITGATGFVGKYITREVHMLGHEILASTLVNDNMGETTKNIQWFYGDLADLNSLKPVLMSFNPDVVIHLAWQGIPDYSESISRVNLINSINLFDFILSSTNCRKILVSGSCWEYGKKQGICKESDPVNIDTYFTWAKNSLNQYLQIKCAERKITLNWFRIFYVYGPGQRKDSLIPTLIKSIGANEVPQIKTPLNKNDFIYVENVAKTFARAINADIPSGVYNLGSGYATSVYDICKIVEKRLLGTKTISQRVLNNGKLDETVNFWGDMEKTEKMLNMNCDTNLDAGIKQYIESIQPKVVA